MEEVKSTLYEILLNPYAGRKMDIVQPCPGPV